MADMMGDMDIAFPNLGIYLSNVPKTIMIGSFGIALYGIVIAIGMLLGLTLAAKIAGLSGEDSDTIWDLAASLLIFSIIGARIYYVIFMWDYYKDNPIEIINIRGGGLAIYGGIIAGVLTLLIYCKRKKKKFPLILDCVIYGLLVGQILGRWGNFFNREVFGEYTDGLFAMRLPVAMVRERDISPSIAAHMTEGINYIQVHPTFLYEGMWNLILLIALLLYRKHKKFDGEIALMYFAGYGIGRAIIESIRTDQLYITGTSIPVSMVLGIVMAAASSAVGLGNLWRFPYLAAQYGGGIFILVYIIIAVTFGFAIMTTEIAIGRKTKLSPIDAYKKVDKRFGWLGWLAFAIPVIIMPYYSVIGGWVTKYAVDYGISLFNTEIVQNAAGDSYFTAFISDSSYRTPLFCQTG